MLLVFAGVAVGAIPSATVPPSAYEGGLINTPNPIDRSANLPITGDVAGGRHFRGPIPYDSTTSFRAPLGSTSLDSFRRYSTVPQGQNGYPHHYSPFYSPSGSVSMTLPGYPGVFSPSSPRIAGTLPQSPANPMADMTPMVEVPQPQGPAGERSVVNPGIGISPRLRYWPMSPSPDEMRNIVSDELGDQLTARPPTQPPDPTMTPEEYRRQLEQLQRDLERVRANASQLGQNLNVESGTAPTQSSLQQPLPPPIVRPAETPTHGLDSAAPTDLYPGRADPSAGRAQPDTSEPGRLPASQRVEETSRAFDATSKFLNRPGKEPDGGARDAAGRLRGAAGSAEDVRSVTEPERVRPTPESLGSITQAQFDHYLAAAELYMLQGRYYRAADSFTLASVYIPHDARAHLGKSHALLAAGEYVSSAGSLAKAIELNARDTLRKVNLVEILGGPESFVQRMANLEDSAKSSDAPQLQFLLAYVYFQMEHPDEAKSAIEAVRKALPSSVAANLLEAAIQGNTR